MFEAFFKNILTEPKKEAGISRRDVLKLGGKLAAGVAAATILEHKAFADLVILDHKFPDSSFFRVPFDLIEPNCEEYLQLKDQYSQWGYEILKVSREYGNRITGEKVRFMLTMEGKTVVAY